MDTDEFLQLKQISGLVSLFEKEYTINVCAGYISRIFSQSILMIKDKCWNYRFNINLNDNQSGAEFFRSVTTLVKEGNVLVILTDSNMVDIFIENSYDLYLNTYSNLTVDDYTFNRTFNARDVVRFRMNNKSLVLFTSSII